MKKTFDKLIEKLEGNGNISFYGGFFGVIGGVRNDNPSLCVNSITCANSNTGSCSNQGICTGTTNTAGCQNSGACQIF